MQTIPKKFVDHMSELPEIVYLKGPSGIKWHVELKRTSDGGCFQSGWKDFAEAHHLEENDLLLFEYDGNSCFMVKILEGSGCEKAHPYCLKIGNSLKRGMRADSGEELNIVAHRNADVSNFSSSSHDDSSSGHKFSSPREFSGYRRRGNKQPRIGSACREKISASDKLTVRVKNTRGNTSKRVDGSNHAGYHIKQESDGLHECNDLAGHEDICIARKSLTAEEEKRAVHFSRGVRPGKPYFVSVMRRTSIERTLLTVPVGFTAYLPLQSCGITLQVPSRKKKWSVRYIPSEFISKFSAGFKNFVLDNGLMEGDICLFELINNRRDNIEMRVEISRLSEDVSGRSESVRDKDITS